jgi:hypothetical protein
MNAVQTSSGLPAPVAPSALQAEAARQRSIVAALFAPDRGAALAAVAGAGVRGTADALALGLGAYRGNGLAIAERALQAIYPVTFELLGDSAASAAAHLWRTEPPRFGDLATWGGAFADWLAGQPSLADRPQWVGCARIEWARHCASGAADMAMAVGSLALLGTHPAETLRLRLKPDVALVHGAPGFYETWARQAETVVFGSESVAVWREGFAPRVLPLDAAWSNWLRSLMDGSSLQSLLRTLPETDLETTLASLIHRGWLLDIITDEDSA